MFYKGLDYVRPGIFIEVVYYQEKNMSTKKGLNKDNIVSNYEGHDKYDLIIIGAGISGLSTALFWQRNTDGRKTLIIEKNGYPGGFVTAYRRGDYVFETTQLFPDVIDILHYLDIEIDLRRFEGTYMRSLIVHGDEVDEYRIPVGPDNFAEYLGSIFPEDARNIRRFIDYAQGIMDQLTRLKAIPTLKDMIMTPFMAPRVIANLNRTYAGMLDKFGLTNTKLREALETFNAFSAVPPDRSSGIVTIGAMLASMTKSYRTYDYFDVFPAEMARLFQERGGEILLGYEVERLVIKGGRVTGVRLKGDKEVIRAGNVVTTIDPNMAMRGLVGDEHLPEKYIKRLENTVMSPSSFNVALGLDDDIDLTTLDLDYPFNVISTGLGSAERLFHGALTGKSAYSKDCFHAAVICPSLTTGSKGTITINVVPFGLDDWLEMRENDRKKYKKEKERWADFFVDIVERYFIPGLKNHIVEKDISTPATYARYSGSPTGSVFDMATTVDQFGPKRLPTKTPIKGLFQPKFAHGIYGGMLNGLQVVDLMLGRAVNNGNSLLLPSE